MNAASNTPVKRKNVASVAVIARSTGSPRTNRSPAATSCRTPGAPLFVVPPSACVAVAGGLGAGSRLRIRPSITAEAPNDSASARMATGAESHCTSSPPSPGPAIIASEWLIWSLALPSTNCSRSTRVGR